MNDADMYALGRELTDKLNQMWEDYEDKKLPQTQRNIAFAKRYIQDQIVSALRQQRRLRYEVQQYEAMYQWINKLSTRVETEVMLTEDEWEGGEIIAPRGSILQVAKVRTLHYEPGILVIGSGETAKYQIWCGLKHAYGMRQAYLRNDPHFDWLEAQESSADVEII
jgi:hypothetical protein